MKENDWIIATMNNPEYDNTDFQIVGMNLNNTQLLSRQEYLKSDLVKQHFTDQNGKFQEQEFNDFYNTQADRFKDFSEQQISDALEYSMFDVMRPADARVKNPNFQIRERQNPEHITIGISGINAVEGSGLSKRELAQKYGKIPGIGKTMDEISLFEDPAAYFEYLFSEPLVYATYDEDTIDPITNEMHHKGDWKVNEDGEYYVEPLNGRSLIGKEVVSALDVITPESSSLNQIDFFDSDDVQKSTMGTLMNNIVTALPLFIPYVGEIYSTILVTKELTKTLPMLYGVVTGLAGAEETESSTLNNIAAIGNKFSASTSDYSKENTFTFENIANLISDVALQWGQQDLIVNGYNRLTKSTEKALTKAEQRAAGKYIEEAQDIMLKSRITGDASKLSYIGTANPNELKSLIVSGKWRDTPLGIASINKYVNPVQKAMEKSIKLRQDLSLAYMALISNTDVYSSVIEKGGTPFEAALLTLGSTIGMFSVDKFLHLGEIFFDEASTKTMLRQSTKEAALKTYEGLARQQVTTATKDGALKWLRSGIKSGEKSLSFVDSFPTLTKLREHSLNGLGKALGEGLEEVSEELVTDITKQFGQIAGHFGIFSQTDYGAFDNMLERYGMSLLGGSLGGGLFYAKTAIQNKGKLPQQIQKDIVQLIRQGKKDDIIKELNNARKKGRLGSTQLSFKTAENDSNTFLTAQSTEDTQNEQVYRGLVDIVNQLDNILNENQLKYTDAELFDKMVQGEYRALALQDYLSGNNTERASNLAYITGYYKDFNDLADKIVNKELEIKQLHDQTPSASRSSEKYKQDLAKLNSEKEELIKQRDYLFGKGSLGYVEKMKFAMDPNILGAFTSVNFNQFVRLAFGRSFDELSESDKADANKLWENNFKNKVTEIDKAFKEFKELQKGINPEIQKLKEEDITRLVQDLITLRKEDPDAKLLDPSKKLEDESDEEYKDAITRREGETEEQFKIRFDERVKKVEELNNKNRLQNLLKFLDLPWIDSSTARDIATRLTSVKAESIESNINTLLEHINFGGATLQLEIKDIIRNNAFDGSKTVNEIKELILEAIEKSIKAKIEQNISSSNTWDTFRYFIEQQFGVSISSNQDITYDLLYGIIKSKFDQDVAVLSKEEIIKQYLDNFNNFLQRYEESIIDYIIKRDFLNNEEATPEEVTAYKNTHLDYLEKVNDDPDYKDFLVFKKHILPIYQQILGDIATGTKKANYLIEYNADNGNTLTSVEAQYIYEDALGINQEVFEKQLEIFQSPDFFRIYNIIDASTYTHNPIFKILQAVTGTDVEKRLQEIYIQHRDSKTDSDFQLSDSTIDELEKIKQDIIKAKAVVAAAAQRSSYDNPIGHNKDINEFVEAHKDIYGNVEKLPELKQDEANFLLYEFENYEREIDAWIDKSNRNTAGRRKKLFDAQQALTSTKIEFYKKNKDFLKLTVHGESFDLLEGIDEIENSNDILELLAIERLIYMNYQKAVRKGATTEMFCEQVISKVTNVQDIQKQLISRLDDTLSYNKLTDYHKASILISAISSYNQEFFEKLDAFIKAKNDIAPLAIQEEIASMIDAQISNPTIINEFLDYVHKNSGIIKSPPLKNTAILTGLAGAGKTDVIAKLIVGEGNNTWISGPTQQQIDKLERSLPKSSKKTIDELLKLATDVNVDSIIKEENGKYSITNTTHVTKGTGLDGQSVAIVQDSFPIKKINNPPKFIIIDEATHIDSIRLQILSKFCEKNGIQLILMGDTFQNGKKYQNLCGNLGREQILAWRPPKLFISLRTSNNQKNKNNTICTNLLEDLQNSSKETQASIVQTIINQRLNKFGLNYYLSEDNFTGELISKVIPDSVIEILKAKKEANPKLTIGFISMSDNNPNLKKLQDAGLGDIITRINPLEVQGNEYDYVIIDKQWDIPKIPNTNDSQTLENFGVDLNTFLQDLYTMITRSKSGSIIIDNNNLSDFVKNVRDKRTVEENIKDQIDFFRKPKLEELQRVLEWYQNNPIPSNAEEERKRKTFIDKINNATTEEEINKLSVNPDNSELLNDSEIKKIIQNKRKYIRDKSNEQIKQDYINRINNATTKDELDSIYNDYTSKYNDTLGDDIKDAYNNKLSKLSTPRKKAPSAPAATKKPTVKKPAPKSSKKIPPIEDSELKTEGKSYIDNKDDNSGEDSQHQKQTNSLITIDFPVRGYGDVQFSGLIKNNDQWVNDTGDRKDLGIFIRHSTKDKRKFNKACENLRFLQGLFLWGIDTWYDRFNMKEQFPLENLKNAKFYIVVEKINSKHYLINNKQLKQEDLEILKGSGITINVVAKFNDADGNECTVTLGGLGRLSTWKSNKTKIEQDLKEKIARLQETSGNEAEINRIQTYLDQQPTMIKQYSDWIDSQITKISDDHPKKEYEINPPQFNMMTELNKLPKPKPLQELKRKNGKLVSSDPYKAECPGAVVSDVYIILEPSKYGVKESLKGKSVIFVSNNPFLSAAELEQEYIDQINNGKRGMVRMFVLNNRGVSFKSLYDKIWADIYTTRKKKTLYTTPFRTQAMGARMYIALWNYRADLSRFISECEKFQKDVDKKYNGTTIQELAELDSRYYNKFIEANPNKKDESSFRYWAQSNLNNEDLAKLQVLWEFNDSLQSIRKFRLGHNSKHGAYIRSLVKYDHEYYADAEKRHEHIQGIYINYQTAQDQLQTLNKLFEVILDKLIDNNKLKTSYYLDDDLAERGNWIKQGEASKDGTFLTLNSIIDENDSIDKQKSVTIQIEGNGLTKIAPIMIVFAKLCKFRQINPNTFDDYMGWVDGETKPGSERFVMIDPADSNKELRWDDIVKDLKLVKTEKEGPYENVDNIPGVIPYNSKTGEGIYDSRLDDLFSLAFHGLISTSYENNFDTDNDARATDAKFKYGFFSDPLLKERNSVEENSSDKTLSRLFFFECDAVPGNSLFFVNTQPKETTKTVQKKEETIDELQLFKDMTCQKIPGINPRQFKKCKTKEVFINTLNSILQTSIIGKFKSSNITIDILNNTYEIQDLDSQGIRVISFSDVIKKLISDTFYNGNPVEIAGTPSIVDESKIRIDLADGSFYNIIFDGREFVTQRLKESEEAPSNEKVVTSHDILEIFINEYSGWDEDTIDMARTELENIANPSVNFTDKDKLQEIRLGIERLINTAGDDVESFNVMDIIDKIKEKFEKCK